MKVYVLKEILKQMQDDTEILIPCAPDALTNDFKLCPIELKATRTGKKFTAIIPCEGVWLKELRAFEPVADPPESA
jgi:hypothetical protein